MKHLESLHMMMIVGDGVIFVSLLSTLLAIKTLKGFNKHKVQLYKIEKNNWNMKIYCFSIGIQLFRHADDAV